MTISRNKTRSAAILLLVVIGLIAACLLLQSPVRIISATPANLGTGVAPDAHISIAFQNAMDPDSMTASTVQLLDHGRPVPARISYNPQNHTVTLDADQPLAYSTQYSALVTGGSAGVRSSFFGGKLPANFSFTFTTTASPCTGPGGPILLISDSARPFSTYYAEILRAEGLNEFAVADIASLSLDELSAHPLVILGEMPLTAAQASLFDKFVRGGGKLIAMRPDAKLSDLLGLRPAGSSASNAYLKFDNSSAVAASLTNTSIQYHGHADLYQLAGATSLATLYSTADTPLPNPAITLHDVGTKGGQAAAFTYDLARSIIRTRQGNPEWANKHRDDQTALRADDELLGPAPSPWVDHNKIPIPQADQQQRLLANMIQQMLLPILPMPRFWYFPNGVKSMIMMSGDDHDNGGTFGRWNQFISDGDSGGMPITGTAYIFPGHNLPNKALAPYVKKGFEVALHVDITPGAIFGDSTDEPVDWHGYSQLNSIYSHQLAIFHDKYPSLPSPITNRTHGAVWSDFDSQPLIEFNHGIRLDANYYYWPPTWVNDRPGMFTGSGMPMRFTTADGKMIDVFQESTVMTDESGQTFPYFVDAMLDAATGPAERYGAFAVNAHIDEVQSDVADAVIASAQAHHVPVVSAAQLLNFTDARDNSSFSKIQWDPQARTLGFTLILAVNADGLDAMIPLLAANGDSLTAIFINDKPVDFTRELISGNYIARFAAVAGTVKAQYAPNPNPLSLVSTSPAPTASQIAINAPLTATFNQPIDAATISFNLKDFNGDLIPAAVAYNATKRTATLTPNGILRSGFTYTAVVTALDAQDHAATPRAWTFTTAAPAFGPGPFSFWNRSILPATPAANDDESVEVGVQFSSDVPGMVTSLRFYKGPGNTGPHVGHLWSSDGELLASAEFTHESPDGWQTVSFSQPVAITPGATYVASYHCNAGHYATTAGYFDHHSADNGPLHAPSNDTMGGGNGVFAQANRNNFNEIGHATNFPSQTNHGTNYWVDIVFVPSPVLR